MFIIMQTVNLIDGSNIFVICYSIIKKRLLAEDNLSWKDLHRNFSRSDIQELQDIFISKIKLFLDQKINIVCFEGKNSTSYRQSIYSNYKGNRPQKHPQFAELLNCCIDALSYLPCKIMKVDNCEGDDCIYTLAKAFIEQYNYNIQIVSTDEDLTQIATFWPPNVKVLNPISKELKEINENIILQKVLVGDSSDNIKFKEKLGPKTFEKMLENENIREKFLSCEKDYDEANIIRQIVDLRLYPYEYRKSIIDFYNNNDFIEPDVNAMSTYFHNATTIHCLSFLINNYLNNKDLLVTKLDFPTENEDIPTIFPWKY